MRMAITTLVFASFLVLAVPVYADDTSTEGIEAPSGEATSPVVAEPAEPSEPVEDDEGKSE